MRLLALAVAAAALQAPPKTHRATRLAATQQLDVGCWMLLVPELNALPGRHAYDQTEFLNTDEILDRVDSIDEAAVLSTCDRYCVFIATKKNLTEALRDVETVVSREIAVRAGPRRATFLRRKLRITRTTSRATSTRSPPHWSRSPRPRGGARSARSPQKRGRRETTRRSPLNKKQGWRNAPRKEQHEKRPSS